MSGRSMIEADEGAYTGLVQALLPGGWAWPRAPEANLTRLVQALGDGFARVHRAVARLLVIEADPRTVEDLLPEWERAFGLPDPCVGDAEMTLAERRRVLTAKVAAKGGQSRAYLIALAAAHGYAVTLEEFRPATCIDPCDTPVYGEPWAYAFRVNAAELNVVWATCVDLCNVPLRTWGNARLECLIDRAKPAHTIALYAYTPPLPTILDDGTPADPTGTLLDDGTPGDFPGFVLDGGTL
jgi:uncharacterized protein YmfQ (DUF2313 family)